MTDTKYAKLREAASYAATEVLRSHGWEGTVSGADFLLAADERYILAASPDVVLSLLEERQCLIDFAQELALGAYKPSEIQAAARAALSKSKEGA